MKKYAIALILALIMLVGQSNFFALAQDLGGDTVDSLNQQKDEKRRKLVELKAQVSDLQKQINQQRQQIASLANEIKLYELQIEQTEKQIEAVNAEIEVVNEDIIDTLQRISETEASIDDKKALLADLIRQIYEYDRTSPLAVVLAHDNFADFLNEIQNTVSFQDRNQELLDSLSTLQAELQVKQSALSEKRNELTTLKTQSEATQASLVLQRSQRQGLLAATRGRESQYQALLADVSEEEAKINREIFELDLAIRQRVGDKSLPPVTGAFVWPMEGVFTQGYGNTGFTRLGYTFHNGIDIAAPPNTQVHSAADGVVYATGTGKTAYGNWVVVRHALNRDGAVRTVYTLYAHLNRISVSSGQAVLAGDLVGLQGNTGNTTRLLYGPERGYHLHFSVFDEEGFSIKEGAYPEIYGPYQIPYGYTYNPMDFLK